MADEEVMFEVNAGQILAKLHLGCKQMFKKIEYYNTGITGKDDGTPEKPGDCMFDLKNMKGQYEVACSMKNYYVIRQLSNEEIEKLKSKMIAKDGKPEEDKLKELKEKLNEKIESLNISSSNQSKMHKVITTWKKFEEGLLDLGFKSLKDYIENFCGKENASKLKKEDLVNCYVDVPFSYKYDNYQMPESKNSSKIKDQEEKLKKDTLSKIDAMDNISQVKHFLDSDSDLEKALRIDIDNLKCNLCFKIGYTVELETM